ncbi:MAG: hypothetical protein J0L97_04690 [Alphaproteobacteria bacterium]|nr:hypothetical protein [Alphaproteobacteria bacterium]
MAKPSVSFDRFSSRKFILSVGDEGAILIYMQGARVLRRLYAPGPQPQDRKILEDQLRADPKAPITVLMDVMDQSYIQQSLPPVSSLGVGKLIQRRLERDFPPEDVKGAITLGRSKEGRKDWNFLFVSLANLPPASEWLEYVMGLPNRLAGIHMLPVESQAIIARFHQKLHQKQKPPEWQILVSHNKVGGFRQVVVRDGKLVFTRLAQPIGESIPEVIAGNIEQEIQNTTEYLKRLGFKEDSQCTAYILVSEDIKQVIETGSMRATEVNIFTPYEAATMLGLSQAAQEQDHFGDVVLAAAFGSKGRPRLRMTTSALHKLDMMHDLASFAKMGAMALVPICLLTFTWQAYDLISVQSNIQFTQAKQVEAQGVLAQMEAKTKELPYDLDKITEVITLYETLSEKDARPLPLLAEFGTLITTREMLLKSLEWEAPPPAKDGPKAARSITAKFDVEFLDPSTDLEKLLTRVNTFRSKLQQAFSGYSITFDAIPGVVGGNETWEQNFSSDGKPQDLEISSDMIFTLRGTGEKPPEGAGGGTP